MGPYVAAIRGVRIGLFAAVVPILQVRGFTVHVLCHSIVLIFKLKIYSRGGNIPTKNGSLKPWYAMSWVTI